MALTIIAEHLRRWAGGLPILCVVVILCCARAAGGEQSAEPNPGSSPFEQRALALRRAATQGADEALRMVASIPGISQLIELNAPDDVSSKALEAMWIPFFENTIVRTFGENSPGPTAIYYNPLLDIALHTRWQLASRDNYQIVELRVIPGERLIDPLSNAPLLPQWMVEDDPAEAFMRVASGRIANALPRFAQRRDGPNKENQATDSYDKATYDFLAAQPRLIWNVTQRLQWPGEQWLLPTLTEIQRALKAHDADTIRAAAPDTDLQTAATLAALPTGFSDYLVLDMVLEDDDKHRVLIGSAPDDGELYLWTLCRAFQGACILARFTLIGIDL